MSIPKSKWWVYQIGVYNRQEEVTPEPIVEPKPEYKWYSDPTDKPARWELTHLALLFLGCAVVGVVCRFVL